ncbi:translocation/assembly module TamB domain-containing protein [Bowmanella dokdonensis]|uniref:Translocation/assembly module TamB domain-containing protein n=1 Tax=Bowmanella dokdonensis TaxID=751969 RepID=A0A939DK35_9ALTE|nr:translocation/assembly module TamB domain-containing protein [Bowmanella dokdonensis]MBN7824178.1 translocation/assembly module TamB domain-containing protein [Bowmanella dokdonensis]
MRPFSFKPLLRTTLLALAILVFLFVAAFYLLTATRIGTGILLGQAESRLEGLTLNHDSGSLLTGLILTDIQYQQAGLKLTASRLELDISARALLMPRLVIQKLDLQQLRLRLPANEQTSAAPANFAGTSKLDLPDWLPPMIIRQMQVTDSRISAPAMILAWQQLDLAASLQGQWLNLDTFLLKGPQVELLETRTPTDDAGWPLANLPTLQAPVNIRLRDVQISDFQLQQSGRHWAMESLALQMHWQDQRVQLDKLALRMRSVGQLDLQGSATLAGPYPLSLNARLRPAAELLPAPLEASPWQLQASGNLQELSLRVKETEQLSLALQGRADLTDSQLPFETEFSLQTEALSPLLSLPDEASFRPGKLTGTASGNLASQQASLQLAVQGFGFGQPTPASIRLKANHGAGQLNNLILTFKDPDSGSSMTFEGQLDYRQPIRWQLDGQIDKLVVDSPLIPVAGNISGSLSHQGEWHDGQWAVQVKDTRLQGTLAQTPLRLRAVADISHRGQLRVENLDLGVEAFMSTLKLTGQAEQDWQIEGRLIAQDLSALSSQLEGQLESDLSISGPIKDPKLDLQGKISQLHTQGLSLSDTGFEARYQPASQHQTKVEISLPSITWDNSQHFYGQASLEGNLEQHRLHLELDGDVHSTLELTGKADPDFGRWQGQLSQARLALLQEEWQLQEPVDLAIGGQTSVSAHCWQGRFSELCLQQPLTLPGQEPIVVSAEVDYGAWVQANPDRLIQQDLQGRATLQASIRLPEQGLPIIDLEASLSSGHLKQQLEEKTLDLLDWQGGTLTVHTDEQGIKLEGRLTDEQSAPMVRLNAQIGPKPDMSLNGELQLSPLPLAGFMPLFPELSRLEGMLGADIRLSGRLDQPQLAGNLQLQQGAITLARSQSTAEQIALSVEFEGNRADFSGQWQMGEGQANLNGTSRWDPGQSNWQEALYLKARLQGQKLQIKSLPELYADVSPNVNIELDKKLNLTGKVTIDSGVVRLASLPESAVSVSDDMVLVNENQRQMETMLARNIDLDIELGEPFSISGFGFNGKLDGSLNARQTSPAPLELYGTLTFTEGFYKAYGQNLEVKSGRLQFLGQADNPVVQLQAIRPLKGTSVEAGIQVSGPANNLKVDLFSNPNMEQSAILSYILRGSAPQNGTDIDGSSMALVMAANQGIGITGASGLTDALNEIPLISDITLDTETDAVSGDSLATVSGYIGERIYLKYGVGILEPVTQVTVRFYLMNQLWLEAVSSLERSMDLYYSFDIE